MKWVIMLLCLLACDTTYKGEPLPPDQDQVCQETLSSICYKVKVCSNIRQSQCHNYLREHGLCLVHHPDELNELIECKDFVVNIGCDQFEEIVYDEKPSICDAFVAKADL